MALSVALGQAGADCPAGDTAITRIVGDEGSPLAEDARVTVAGTVTATFLGPEALNGFYLAQAGTGGGPPHGVFVYAPELTGDERRALAPGRRVFLRGRTGRWRGQIQVERLTELKACGNGVDIPVSRLEPPWSEGKLRRLAGLPIVVAGPLEVANNHSLGRYGSLRLTHGERPRAADGPIDDWLVLDDGSNARHPRPIPHLDADGTRRAGSRLPELEGVLAATFGRYRVHPTGRPSWQGGNARRPAPEAAGDVRIVAYNLDNLFFSLGERGAQTAAQRRRQQAKLGAAIDVLDADVLALMEVENSAAAMQRLLEWINAGEPAAERYRLVGKTRSVGGDAIRNVVLYRPAALDAVPEPITHAARVYRRPVVGAELTLDDGTPVRLLVAHFKSKGGCPDGVEPADPLAGCWGERRLAEARAMANRFLGESAARTLLVGDLNAYAGEPPLAVLEGAGLIDLLARHLPPAARYTYVYRGYAGYLDHAWAGAEIANRVAAVTTWPINADEPPFLAYDGREGYVNEGPYRSSDHDPVIVDLR